MLDSRAGFTCYKRGSPELNGLSNSDGTLKTPKQVGSKEKTRKEFLNIDFCSVLLIRAFNCSSRSPHSNMALFMTSYLYIKLRS